MLSFNLSGLSMSLEIDTSGLERQRGQITEHYQRSMKEALRVVVRDREKRLEDAFRRAGLGKLARGWASEVFPKHDKLADSPAASIYPNGGRFTRASFRAHTQGARITPKLAEIMWIPVGPAARRRMRDRDLSPEDWERINRRELKPVVRPNGTILLFDVRDDTAKKRQRRQKRGHAVREPVLVFIGIRVGVTTARVSIDREMEGAAEQLKHEFLIRAREAGK